MNAIARRGGCATGCIVVAVIGIIVLVAGGLYVANNWRDWVVGAAEEAMRSFLAEIDVDAAQKEQMRELVDAVLLDFKDKQISFEQLESLGQAFEASPLVPMGLMLVAEASYVTPRDWPAEEKEAARRTLERLTRGMVEETVPAQRLDDVLAPISAPSSGGDGPSGPPSGGAGAWGELELKPPSEVTDDELREFLVLAKEEADRVGVPDEPYEIDLALELRRVVVDGLGRPLPRSTQLVIDALDQQQLESPDDQDAGADAEPDAAPDPVPSGG